MKITKLKIEGVGGIESLELTPNPHMNILCGPNGIGKTTVLEVISHGFANGQSNVLKRHVNSPASRIQLDYEIDGTAASHQLTFDTFAPGKPTPISGMHQQSSGILSLKTTRTFQYRALEAIGKDPAKENRILWNEAMLGINLNDVKNWFVNRFLFSHVPNGLSKELLANYQLAKQCFDELEPGFSFATVEASSHEIMVNAPTGLIYYEYLSSGFKSIISILFGIIKEVEYRFTDPRIAAADFGGIILIDELDLHLHPAWQTRIAGILSKTFPKAQFFATTHSPHIIQGAPPNEIIALGRVDDKVIQRQLPDSTYGFQGWSIDEVLTDVMGMKDTRTGIYQDAMAAFQTAVDYDAYTDAKEAFAELDRLLHPSSHMRKLLAFQLAGITADSDG